MTGIAGAANRASRMRPRDDWDEDDGPVLWWHLNEWGQVAEAPAVGGLWEITLTEPWPDYYVAWSPMAPFPCVPVGLRHAPAGHRLLICDGWDFGQ